MQMYIGDGAKLVRDAFDLAKDKIKKEGKKGAIIFIDEIDAVGTKRYGGEQTGESVEHDGRRASCSTDMNTILRTYKHFAP